MKMVGCASFLSWLVPEKCVRMLDANVYVAPYMPNTLHFHKIYLLKVHFLVLETIYDICKNRSSQ